MKCSKQKLGITDGVTHTDMMPIINIVWKNSFARRVKKHKQAIVDRRWNLAVELCLIILDDANYVPQ